MKTIKYFIMMTLTSALLLSFNACSKKKNAKWAYEYSFMGVKSSVSELMDDGSSLSYSEKMEFANDNNIVLTITYSYDKSGIITHVKEEYNYSQATMAKEDYDDKNNDVDNEGFEYESVKLKGNVITCFVKKDKFEFKTRNEVIGGYQIRRMNFEEIIKYDSTNVEVSM